MESDQTTDISDQPHLRQHDPDHTSLSPHHLGYDDVMGFIVRKHEGVSPFPYQDTAGKMTIGVGRNLTDRGLNAAEIDFLFATDCALARTILDSWWPAWQTAPQGVQIALFSMAFNLGLPRLSGFVKMRDALAKGEFQHAASEALDSRWASQVEHRADDVAALMTGDMSCLLK